TKEMCRETGKLTRRVPTSRISALHVLPVARGQPVMGESSCRPSHSRSLRPAVGVISSPVGNREQQEETMQSGSLTSGRRDFLEAAAMAALGLPLTRPAEAARAPVLAGAHTAPFDQATRGLPPLKITDVR